MLTITYQKSGTEETKTYETAGEFIAAQLKEVPDLPDYYHVVTATEDGQKIELNDQTISGLFNYLNRP